MGVVSQHLVTNACSTEVTPGWIGVRTNWAYRLGRFRTKMPKFRKFCPDKNGRFREILGSNIYSYYQGSSYRKSMWYQCGPILSGSADQAQKILCNLSLKLEKTHPTLEFLFFDTVICTNKFCLSLFFSCYKSHFETTSEHNKK